MSGVLTITQPKDFSGCSVRMVFPAASANSICVPALREPTLMAKTPCAAVPACLTGTTHAAVTAHTAQEAQYCESMGKTSNAVLRDYVLDCIDEKEAGE